MRPGNALVTGGLLAAKGAPPPSMLPDRGIVQTP
jgi:hypothetical protein